MVDAHEITSFIKSKKYQETLRKIEERIKIKVREEYSESLSILSQRKLNSAQMSIQEAEKLLNNSEEKIIKYTIKKYHATHDIDEKIGISKESENTNLINYAMSYLLNNIIEIFVAERGNKELEKYLTIIRVQSPKKYANQVSDWIKSN